MNHLSSTLKQTMVFKYTILHTGYSIMNAEANTPVNPALDTAGQLGRRFPKPKSGSARVPCQPQVLNSSLNTQNPLCPY